MVLHDHQANPHVHISVRAESKHSRRLNPRKTDLHRWRETFAAKLRGYGIEAEATRQATRERSRNSDDLWRLKAREDGRLRTIRLTKKYGENTITIRAAAIDGWREIARALTTSGEKSDQDLARSVLKYVDEILVLARADRTMQSKVPSEAIRLVEQQTRGSFHER